MNTTTFVKLTLLVALLVGVFVLKSGGGASCTDQFLDLMYQKPPDSLEVAEAMEAARGQETAMRINTYLEWIGRGASGAEGELELWLERDYQPGSLRPEEVSALENVALRWPDRRVRRAAAGILLKEEALPEMNQAASVLGVSFVDIELRMQGAKGLWLYGVRGETGAVEVGVLLEVVQGERDPKVRQMAFWALAASGDSALQALKGILLQSHQTLAPQAGAALGQWAYYHPQGRNDLVEWLLAQWERMEDPAMDTTCTSACLDGIRITLKAVAGGEDQGQDLRNWQRWWQRVKRRMDRFLHIEGEVSSP